MEKSFPGRMKMAEVIAVSVSYTHLPEVIRQLSDEGSISPERTISGENPILIYRFADANTLITLGAIGCPACAGNLDLFNAMEMCIRDSQGCFQPDLLPADKQTA